MQKYFKYQFVLVMFLMFLIGISSIYFLANIYFTTQNMYEHPYRVSNELKQLRISIHQINLASQDSADIDFQKVGQQDSTNRLSLGEIAKSYQDDIAEVTLLKQLYEQWLTTRVYSADSELIGPAIGEQEIFNQLLAEIEVMSRFADNNAAELFKKAQSDALLFAVYIAGALLLAGVLALYLYLRTLTDLREVAANRKQYRYLIDQNVMIAAVEQDGSIFEISNQLSRFLAMSKQSVLNKPIKEIFFSENGQFEEMWQDVTSGANWHGELKIICDTDTKWLGVDVLPMQDSDFSYSGFRLLAQDISDKKSLEHISITDTLTGLLNRRTLDETLDRVTRVAQRHKESVTIAMLDVDFFKQFNDTYGHAAGDNVLTSLSDVLSGMFARANDYAFRVGGEEFVAVFNGKDVETSLAYLEKVRLAVRSLNITHEHSKVDSCVTISIGAVYFDGNGLAEGQLILSDADSNLYRAKETRNHTVQTIHGKPPPVFETD
ncbi:hypothetical protein A9Q78_06870 [Methylophaga sp. 41_12_T18]|nr:hypothetical protein A9Q78_06870 [Methylophaga sp. 41_12_T18]